jgi:hypothetical protein
MGGESRKGGEGWRLGGGEWYLVELARRLMGVKREEREGDEKNAPIFLLNISISFFFPFFTSSSSITTPAIIISLSFPFPPSA